MRYKGYAWRQTKTEQFYNATVLKEIKYTLLYVI
jgi:hypothetical protein